MRRKWRFKFKLSRRQKKKLLIFAVLGILAFGGFWLYKHPHRPKIRPKEPAIPTTLKLSRPRIVFVIDDIGVHDKLKNQLEALGNKVTYAILPLLRYSHFFGNLSKKTKAEVILHLPLDTVQDIVPGKGLIVSTMSDANILDMLARDLASVPNHVGVNNHMGSRGTTDREMMTVILRELKRRNLFFLDSYTTRDSVVTEIARSVGIPFLKRGVFLDNVDTKVAIRSEIKRLEGVAREKGTAIAIGHYRKNTLEVLAREIPRLERQGFKVISLKELLKLQRD